MVLKEKQEPSLTFIRLASGDDIVAMTLEMQKNETEDSHVLLKDPLRITYMVNPGDPFRLSISLSPWVFDRLVESQEFKVYTCDILTTAIPSKQITEFYNDMIERATENLEMVEADASTSSVPDDSSDGDNDDGSSEESTRDNRVPIGSMKPTLH